jgi:opacity protein-like surface antigen
MSVRQFSATVLLILALAPQAPAQAPTTQDSVSFTDDRRWAVQVMGSAMVDVTNRDVQMAGPTVGVGYYIYDNLAGNLELGGQWVQQDQETTAGTATVVLRHHILEMGKATLFLDVGGGIVASDEPVPAGGTEFNFTFQCGTGVTWPVGDGVYLLAGVRYYHLSNANMDGADENPSLNGPLGYVGLMFMH